MTLEETLIYSNLQVQIDKAAKKYPNEDIFIIWSESGKYRVRIKIVTPAIIGTTRDENIFNTRVLVFIYISC